MLRKIVLLIGVLTLLALGLSLVSAQDMGSSVMVAPDGEIVIGVAAALSGEGLAPLGEDIVRGAQLANIARPTVKIGDVEFAVTLDPQDDTCAAEGGQAVANRYVSDGRVAAVIGPMCSSACRAAAPIFDEAGYTSVSPSCTAPDLTDGTFASFNRVVPTDAFQGVVDAEFIFNTLGLTKIATIHDGSPYGEGLVTVVAETFVELGGEVVYQDAVNVGDTDFRALLDRVAENEPELIFFAGFIAEGARLASQRFDAGLDEVAFMGADGVFSPDFITTAGDAAEGVYVSSPTPSSDIYAEFVAAYNEEFSVDQPSGPYHANAADAYNVILNAIEASASVDANGDLVIDRAALGEAIRATADYEGLIGNITCDETGECASAAITIYQVTDGAFAVASTAMQGE
ncbi:MAG: branched-chain amino acid ABC transporter substrate-binding protein [Anaerolineae bacterium]|nr:branched-chain amino acid ABC transporter substrate-binding protein [Anaerolineae bacterium]